MSDDMTIAGYRFNNAELFSQAFKHPSMHKKNNNQRLEFLGDSVLGLVIAEALYLRYPDEQEGELARRQAALVCGDTLVELAGGMSLGKYLQLSESEAQAGGRATASNLEDACEALIGAIYLDGGLDAAKAWILTHWQPLIESITEPPKDAKTSLQEWAQGRALGLPVYEVVEQSGPAHAPEFIIKVSVADKGSAEAKAGSKKQAEQEAAAKLFEQLT